MIRYWISSNNHEKALSQLLSTISSQKVTYINTTTPELLLNIADPTLYDSINYEHVIDLQALLQVQLSSVVVIENLSSLYQGQIVNNDKVSFFISEILQKIENDEKVDEFYLIDVRRSRFIEVMCDEVCVF
ncbi:hypothetical protein KGF56_001811 [Candida oxycetoniae]|uniref:Uncharacterized protein n=1 Tax=Candida oxycetoniae TaxID=497107 RepID=A0AAI9WYS9_9ASCO|nr:uncharacterized protein KGF56_001811 [Candida oxycetoniae]KAI3405364.1 hypothetical protein KGF56_001811 [Candida oxycetoniae]